MSGSVRNGALLQREYPPRLGSYSRGKARWRMLVKVPRRGKSGRFQNGHRNMTNLPLIPMSLGLSWCVSLLICLPPILGWRAEHRQPGDCTVSQDIGYVLYSSLGSFYIPMAVIVTVYARIYVLAKRRNHQRLSASQRIKQTLRRVSARRSRRSQGKTAEEERKEILDGLTDGVGPAEINPVRSSVEEANNLERRELVVGNLSDTAPIQTSVRDGAETKGTAGEGGGYLPLNFARLHSKSS